MRRKITVVGAGNVGSTCAQRIAERGYADVVLVDIIEGLPQGKALDIQQSGAVLAFDSRVSGTNCYEDTADCDIAVITSGMPRKPGMSRDDLVQANAAIVKSVVESVARYSPNCIVIMVTNPLDAMAQLALRISGFPKNRVLGQSGVLDAARFASFLAVDLGVSVEEVNPCVLGGHGDSMVAIPRLTTVGGMPVTELLPRETIDRIVERTVRGGAEIVELMKGASAYYAPSAAVLQMVDAIVLDKKRIIPCSVYLEGEYGIRGVFLSVPVKLGAGGVEQVVEVKLTAEEHEALARSAETVRQLVNAMNLESQA